MKTGRATIYPVNMEDPGDAAENLFSFKPSEPVFGRLTSGNVR